MQHPDPEKDYAICGAKTRSGGPCKNPPVTGKKRCRMHGGASDGRPIIHGRYSVKHRQRLAESIAKFLEDPRPGDLHDELALNRALLQDFLDRYPDGIPLDVGAMKIVYDMTEAIGRTVERISRILNQTALTQADLQYLQAVLSDLLLRYIDDPEKRIAFLGELRKAMGADRGAGRKIAQQQISEPVR